MSRPISPEYPTTPEGLGVVTIDLLERRKPKRKDVLTRRRRESKLSS